MKMSADYKRYQADFMTGELFKSKMEEAKKDYDLAHSYGSELFTCHPLRLAIALNFAVFVNDIMHLPKQAVQIAKEAFENALFELETVEEEKINETLRVMQLLKDNYALWEMDVKVDEVQGINDEEDPQAVKMILQNRMKLVQNNQNKLKKT
mmetsp:Transcript_41741/g.40098  ORF Transcript_41741/g.40098 Transcript_41741/m.40098 type:complete len:152 (-) Transcript_41741:31-486(-)